MQAKLPDVNAALVRHRNAIMIAYDQGDFQKAGISLGAMIALLPDDYKLEVNTDKYDELVQSKHNIICTECKAKHLRDTIHPYSVLLSDLDALLSHEKTMIVWECPSCKNVQPLQGSSTKTTKYQNP